MNEPIHISVPGSADDPRLVGPPPPGIVVHYVPDLHPDDVVIVDGIPTTSVARTLIDCADELDRGELRAAFRRAHMLGILDMEAVAAARGRVEWRPSLTMLDEVIAEFS